jgi:type IV pilus assembly protein PilQ
LIDRTGQDVYVPSSDPSAEQILRPVYDSDGRLKYVPSNDPTAEQVLRPVYDKDGRLKYVPDSNQYRQPDNSFYAYLEAQIQTRNTRIIAQPTLLVQEGQQSSVVTGEKVITNVEESQSSTGGSNTFTFEKETAGLTMGVSVDKIDDNGFVTLSLNPTVSVPVPAGQQSGVPIFNINERTLTSGDIRLRDGQTLVLTGVINEQQRELVSKWPILGDLPFLGSLFRSTSSTRTKDELVILVTPRILDDNQGGTYGYGYRPGTSEGTRFLRDAS